MPGIKAIAFALLLATPCVAAEVNPCAASSSTSEVQLVLALNADHAIFQEGEIIPLTLSFTSTAKDRYEVYNQSYDYNGRIPLELYCVEPEAPDPLGSYFAVKGSGGGPGGRRVLGTTPLTKQADLNEFRTLSPGHYRLYAISYRIWRRSDLTELASLGKEPVTIRSNSVELEVKPASPQWLSQQLQSALQSLKLPSSDEDERQAARRLRFLNTKDSTRELARVFSPSELDLAIPSELLFGLHGSPYRQLAIDSMHEEIAAPGHAISHAFLVTLVELQITADPSWIPPGVSKGPEAEQAAEAYWRRRQFHEQEILKTESKKVLAALPHKVGPARPLSAVGVLISEADDPAFVRAVRPILLATWNDLPEGDQQELIESQWRLLAGPDMLPILLRMVSGPPPEPNPYGATIHEAALQRILELDPATARPLIRRELGRSRGNPSPELLKLLSTQDSVAAVQPAIDRIAHNRAGGQDFELVDQSADGTALAPMKAMYEGNLGRLDCSQRVSMLRYFLRVAPEYGAAKVQAAQKKTGKTDCRGSLFQSLEDQLPHAEKVAIKALEDPNGMVVRDAARALSRWGSSAAEAPLWARLERLHQKWSGHEDEFIRIEQQNPFDEEHLVEQDLIAAIAAGTNWLCTPDKLARLGELAVTAGQRQQVEAWIDDWKSGPPTIRPIWWNAQFVEFSVLASEGLTEEQLKAKLVQFPRGTRVLWELWRPGHINSAITLAQQEAEYETMRALAEKNGIILVKDIHP